MMSSIFNEMLGGPASTVVTILEEQKIDDYFEEEANEVDTTAETVVFDIAAPTPVSTDVDVPKRKFGWTSDQGARNLLDYCKSPTRRIPTGFHAIDKKLGGGVGIGEVCVIIGRSGSGKSLAGQNVLESNLNIPALMFSMEMPGSLLMARSLAMFGTQSYFDIFDSIENNRLDSGLLARWATAHKNHYYSTSNMLTLDDMTDAIAEAERSIGARPLLVEIDYMELVQCGRPGADTIERVTTVAQSLKAWAKTNKVAVIVLHQVNKTLAHGDAPDEDSVRYGGFTEADIVIGVWRPHRWQPKNKTERALATHEVQALQKQIALNLIKNRPRVDLHPEGYLYPLDTSGRIISRPNERPETVTTGGASY
jgi:replicative DNA helicase